MLRPVNYMETAMPSPDVLREILKGLWKATKSASESFDLQNTYTSNCRKKNCSYCKQNKEIEERQTKNIHMLLEAFEGLNLTSVSSSKIVIETRSGFGLWNGFITDDGFYIHARIHDGETTGDIGHTWVREEYEIARGEERAKKLLKLHAQYKTELILYSDTPPLTKAQISTLVDLVLSADEMMWFTFRMDINHPSDDIPF